LQNAPFCPIQASGSNFNPQNTQCVPACPVGPADRTGVVKIVAFLGLEPRLNNKNRFNWAGKIERFAKVSMLLVIGVDIFNNNLIKDCFFALICQKSLENYGVSFFISLLL
jgi:hypothetical protein